MTDTEQKKTNPDEKDATQEAIAKVDRILRQVQSGWTVAIYRRRPSWCAGFLERIEIFEDDPVDIDYLIDTWGGHVLTLKVSDQTGTWKGGCDVKLMTYQPRRHGRPIKRYEELAEHDDVGETKKRGNRDRVHIVPAASPPPQQQSNNLADILALVQNMSKENFDLVQSLVGATQTDAPQAQSSISTAIAAIKELKELKGLFGEAEQTIQADDSGALFGTITELIRSFTQSNQAPPPAVQPPRLYQQNPQAPQPQQAPQGAGRPQGQQPQDLAQILSTMPPQASAEMVFSAVAAMEPSDREQAIDHFLTRLQTLDGVDLEHEDPDDAQGGAWEGDDTTDPDPTGA